MNRPDLSFETACGVTPVCGVDEVGRGPWAGPVTCAAVILDVNDVPEGLNDSKKLSAARREQLFVEIMQRAHVGIGQAEVSEIDEINILQATFRAMERAVAALPIRPRFALIDGNKIPPGLNCDARAIVKGDGRSVSIAAASIVAKVTRDRLMVALSQQYPGYSWETNVGYGTKAHQVGLAKLGITPHHRRSFKPIHKILNG